MNTIQDHKKRMAAGILTPGERLAIVRKTAGTWKRPLKESLRELAKIRRGWDRKLP